LGQAICPDKS